VARIADLVKQWRSLGPVAWAEHSMGWLMEDGNAIKLTAWQRAVLEAWWHYREYTATLAISNVKKTGKTTLDAVLLCWRWLALPGQHFVCANDMDQSQGLQFRMIASMVKRHPFLSQHVKATASKLVFEATGSELEALSVDAAGSAGALHITSSHTEAWGIQYESSKRAWEELTPQPGEFYGLPALRIVDSYAGWVGESGTWHDLVDRGLAGERVSDEWPIWWTDDGLLLFHMQGEEAQKRCFRGNVFQRVRYYSQQRASLRPNAYKRMHLNERTTGEDAFITLAMWEALPVGHWRDVPRWQDKALSVGLDVGIKHDYTACVTVFEHEGIPHLGPWRVWRPPVVSFEAVEEYLVGLNGQWRHVEVWADPYQAQQLMERLRGKRVTVHEFPQTVGYLTEAGNRLYEAIRDGRLVVGPGADELRDHLLGASAKETERGIRLVKTTQGRRIDLAVALAMALVRVEPEGAGKVHYLPGLYDTGQGMTLHEWFDAGKPEHWQDYSPQIGMVAHSPSYYRSRERARERDCKAAGGPPAGCVGCWWRMRGCPDASYDRLAVFDVSPPGVIQSR